LKIKLTKKNNIAIAADVLPGEIIIPFRIIVDSRILIFFLNLFKISKLSAIVKANATNRNESKDV
jgi:hypothetical protein